jgi:hypothetical protein
MTQSHQNSPKDFPNLRLEHLKRFAQEWAEEFSGAEIKRIVLHYHSARHSKYTPRTKHVPFSYAIVFEVPNINHEEYQRQERLGYMDPKYEAYGKLLAATEHYQTHEHIQNKEAVFFQSPRIDTSAVTTTSTSSYMRG